MDKKRKYRNHPTQVDGIRFASKAEAKRYQELLWLERGGEITELKLQPKYTLEMCGTKICDYIADFEYLEKPSGRMKCYQLITEDVKGVETPVFKLKARMFKALYGREIRITK